MNVVLKTELTGSGTGRHSQTSCIPTIESPSWRTSASVLQHSPLPAGPARFIPRVCQNANTLVITLQGNSTPLRLIQPFIGHLRSKRLKDGMRRLCPGFAYCAAKVPQVITHEKVLVDCEADFKQFVDVMDNKPRRQTPRTFTASNSVTSTRKPF